MSDLYLSPKFAHYISDKGMLGPLIIAFQEYRERQNYPFELKDRRIAMQSIFKGLCEFYAGQGFNREEPVTKEQILKETGEIVDTIWSSKEKDWEKKEEKESTKMVKKAMDKADEANENKKTYVLDIKGLGKTKDFHAECQADSKEEAYKILLGKYPGIGKSKKESAIKNIKLKKA